MITLNINLIAKRYFVLKKLYPFLKVNDIIDYQLFFFFLEITNII